MKDKALRKYLEPGRLEVGCDEAGRGCLAGPVFAAAVALPEGFRHEQLNDSKKLSLKVRNLLRPIIEEEALAWSVAQVEPDEIDEINILNASIRAMHLAVDGLIQKLGQLTLSGNPESPDFLLIDGHQFTPYPGIPHSCEIKGDGRFLSIAAASVLAKTHRDEYMMSMHEKHPHYGWDRNKGYPTRQHREAIKAYGITPLHRKSFRLLDEQLEIDF